MTVHTLNGNKWTPQARREFTYLVTEKHLTPQAVTAVIECAEQRADSRHESVTQSTVYFAVRHALNNDYSVKEASTDVSG